MASSWQKKSDPLVADSDTSMPWSCRRRQRLPGATQAGRNTSNRELEACLSPGKQQLVVGSLEIVSLLASKAIELSIRDNFRISCLLRKTKFSSRADSNTHRQSASPESTCQTRGTPPPSAFPTQTACAIAASASFDMFTPLLGMVLMFVLDHGKTMNRL